MKSLTAFWLLLRGGAHIAGGWWTIRTRFPRLTQSQREAEVQRWARNFLRVWRIDLQVNGAPPKDGPLLVVVNHISWRNIRNENHHIVDFRYRFSFSCFIYYCHPFE